MAWNKGKKSEDDNQSGLPKFVKDNRNKAEREAARQEKLNKTRKKFGGKLK